MEKTIKFKDHLMQELKDPEMAAEFLNACFEDDDPELILLALRDVAEALGGINEIAKKTKVSRMTLYRALSKGGNPEFLSLFDILKALNLKLSFKPNRKFG